MTLTPTSEQGYGYWYNTATHESVWAQPAASSPGAAFAAAADAAAASASAAGPDAPLRRMKRLVVAVDTNLFLPSSARVGVPLMAFLEQARRLQPRATSCGPV